MAVDQYKQAERAAPTSGKRSPLKGRPLRQAGQSVQEEINAIVDDQLLLYVIVGTVVVILAALEWYQYLYAPEPHPWGYTFMAGIVLMYCVSRFRRALPRLKHLKQGRDGEKAVGEYLERLRQNGCVVFHDIVAEGFNIDHVVLSERGVFVIETKTLSKPKGEAFVWVEGQAVRVDGLGDCSAMAVQAMANARWIRNMLREAVGKDLRTHPVLLFPGWYVQNEKGAGFWALSPKRLPGYLKNEAIHLSDQDVRMAAFSLSRNIRGSQG